MLNIMKNFLMTSEKLRYVFWQESVESSFQEAFESSYIELPGNAAAITAPASTDHVQLYFYVLPQQTYPVVICAL